MDFGIALEAVAASAARSLLMTTARMQLASIAHLSGWERTVNDAFDRKDGLPLVVFADWLEERNRVDQATQVRQIAARLAERADNWVPTCYGPARAVADFGLRAFG